MCRLLSRFCWLTSGYSHQQKARNTFLGWDIKMIVMFLLQEISRCFSMTGGGCLLLKVPDAPQAPMSWRRDVTTRNACCKVHPRRSTVGRNAQSAERLGGQWGNHRQIGILWVILVPMGNRTCSQCEVRNSRWQTVISWRCSDFGWDDSSVGKNKIPWGMIRCCDPGMVKLWHGSLREKVPVYG